MRGLLLSLFMVLGLALNAQPALAVTCTQQNATELMERGDVAATGVVDFGWSVPFGFVFAPDHVYKGNLPAHVLVLGQFRPSDLGSTRHFLVMRFHLPGIYSMNVCDGRELPDSNLGPLGEARAPSPNLPVAQASVGVVIALVALLLLRRGRGKPAAPAAASAY
ncbi:MAG: hypothetical protein E6I48_08070 [Chloroflexi bacterium]|nr:MAG: hypothetical protein E6I48_08070 [Chloroflexota bacterium]